MVKNLRIGESYKNYRVLCSVLGEKIRTGKSRQLQLKEWKRKFEYHKEGNKFVIDKIFDEEKIKTDKRKMNGRADYMDNIERVILNMLDKNEGDILSARRNLMLLTLNMVNDNYVDHKFNRQKIAEEYDLETENVNEFFNLHDDMCKRNVESALNNLKKKFLIHWGYEVILSHVIIENVIENDNPVTIKKVVLDEKNNKRVEYHHKTNVKYERRIATDDEIKSILKIKRNVMKDLGCKNEGEIIRNGKGMIFMKVVKDIMLKEMSVNYYFNNYKIIYTHDIISEYIKENNLSYESDDSKIDELNNINTMVIRKVLENANNRVKRAERELQKEKPTGNPNNYRRRVACNYIDNYEELSSLFIDNKEEKIDF